MSKLSEFINLLEGNFDNSEQYNKLKDNGFPFARHVNTICNSKIKNLPNDFMGIFILEESYYTLNEKTNSSSHLFLFTEEEEGIKLTSYEIPKEYGRNVTYADIDELDYLDLKVSEKFTPAIYKLNDGIWEGGSESMFTPVLKFKLFERFSEEMLEVSETMEMNGKRTFGYDEPIIYKKIK